MFFDMNVALGRMASGRGGFRTVAELQGEMKRLGISCGLVHHACAAEADVALGNRLLREAIEGQGNLYPCWVMVPPTLGDFAEPRIWVREAVDAGVKAVRVFPRHSLYTLSAACLGPLAAALEGVRLPLLMDFGPHHWSERVIPWDGVGDLCGRHPRLAVVLIGCTVGEARDVVGMLRTWPNLHIEYHAFGVPGGLGLLAREGLASRALFGTGLPARAGECVVEQTRRSGLSGDDLEAVSSGNARRLLRLPAGAGDDAALRTDALPLVVDVHAHVGAWERTITPVRTPEDVVRSMDRCGVHAMVVSSFAAIHGETRAGNRQTAEAVADSERLFGYAVANPHYPEETEDELAWCFDEARGGPRGGRFVGLKLHCGLHGVPLQHPGYERALAFADARGLPVLVHGSGQDAWRPIAERYPRATFIMAHACAWDGRDDAGRALYASAATIPNLYVDVAGSAAHRGALRALADLVGPGKILFGSDFPMFDLAFELGRVVGAELTPDEKAAICAGNALRIFKGIALPSLRGVFDEAISSRGISP